MGKPAKVRRSWDSLTDFVEYCLGDTDMTYGRASRRIEGAGDGKFFGSKDFKTAQSLAFNWKDGAERVKRMQTKVSLGNVRPAQALVAMKKAPGRLDMGRAMQGHPYAFARVVTTQELAVGPSRNVVDLFVNACVSAGVSTKVIEARGAAMLALADALEQNGKRVRITVGMANDRGCGIDYKIVVKQPGMPLNLQSVSFAVAHPSFFRRFIFSAMERENEEVRNSVSVGFGYGTVGEFKASDMPEGAIYLGGADLRRTNDWNDPGYVQGWIIEKMGEQGIDLSL